jgi:hypothetical protein
MLTRKIFTCLFSASLLLGSGLYLTAQDSNQFGQAASQLQQTSVIQRLEDVRGIGTADPRWRLVGNREQNRFANETATAVQAFKAAESEEAKSAAKAELRKALMADYENKMDQYDEHLEKLEKELEAMRDRLSRRRAAKEDMVDLKLKETIANAEGLGWPSGPNSMNPPGRMPTSFSTQFQQTAPSFPSPVRLPASIPIQPAQPPTLQRTEWTEKTN